MARQFVAAFEKSDRDICSHVAQQFNQLSRFGCEDNRIEFSAADPYPQGRKIRLSLRNQQRHGAKEIAANNISGQSNSMLNEAQSEKPDIKVQSALRIARNRSHVMESGDGWIHASSRVSP